jgi:hypothetical protein
MPAIAMWACGHGLVAPTTITPALKAFLGMETTSFDCHERISVGRPTTPASDLGGKSLVEIPIPPTYSAIVGSGKSFLQTAADRLMVAAGGTDCPSGPFQLTLTYEKSPQFNRSLTVDVPTGGNNTLPIVPAFIFRGSISAASPCQRNRCIASPT